MVNLSPIYALTLLLAGAQAAPADPTFGLPSRSTPGINFCNPGKIWNNCRSESTAPSECKDYDGTVSILYSDRGAHCTVWQENGCVGDMAMKVTEGNGYGGQQLDSVGWTDKVKSFMC